MTSLDLARETLLRLAALRLPPTPENYLETYRAIEASNAPEHHPQQHNLWGDLVASLPQETQTDQLFLERLHVALERRDLPELIQEVVSASTNTVQTRFQKHLPRWAELIMRLLEAWDEHIPGLTMPKKRQAIERALMVSQQDLNEPGALIDRLERLLESWKKPLVRHDSRVDLAEAVNDACAETKQDQANLTLPDRTAVDLPFGWDVWQRIMSECLQHGVAPRFAGFPELTEELLSAGAQLQGVRTAEDQDLLARQLKRLWIRTDIAMQHESRLVHGLVNLLGLLLENLDELAGSDRRLSGQIEMVRELIESEPITMRSVYEVESGLKEVIYQQGLMKHSLDQATDSMRDMLNIFTERLSMMVDNTGDYQSRIADYNQKIKDTTDPLVLGEIVDFLMNDTRSIQTDLVSTRDQLLATREKVQSAEQRIEELQQALDAASAKIREDQLTGAFNRLGLEEIFEREYARSMATNRPLSISLIDIDNFKKLNDRYGHLVGDDALKHLVKTALNKLRPTDYVARFGGEEFVVLLPETDEATALELITRLQRELTRAYFMADNAKLVLTFSAGVTECLPNEQLDDIIDRADQAMYAAKLAGKNRTILAPRE